MLINIVHFNWFYDILDIGNQSVVKWIIASVDVAL
jgi:hypothetical protein